MRSYISPIGYNSTSVVRPILSQGLDSGDIIQLLRPNAEANEPRAAEAIGDVERLLNEIEPDVSLRTAEITYDAYPSAVLEVSKLIIDADGDVIVNLSGGARDILLPLTTASLVHADLVSETLAFSDIDGSVRTVALPTLTGSVSNNVTETLATIATFSDTVSIPVLTEELEQSKSSITRHVSTLENVGFVRSEKHGRTKIVELTFSGELFLRASGSS